MYIESMRGVLNKQHMYIPEEPSVTQISVHWSFAMQSGGAPTFNSSGLFNMIRAEIQFRAVFSVVQIA